MSNFNSAALFAAFVSLLALPTGALRAASDNTLGMAIMSATVRDDGTLDAGSGVTSVSHNGTGNYSVFFDRVLVNCSCTASVGEYNTYHTRNYSAVATPNCPGFSGSQASAVVFTYADTSLADLPFQLIVFCPK